MNALLHQLSGFVGFLKLVRDPSRIGSVLSISHPAPTKRGPRSLHLTIEALHRSPQASLALSHRKRLDPVSLEALRILPADSLGAAFAAHVQAANLDLGIFPEIVVRGELDYLRAHLYETHDLWHVVTGFGTDLLGEVGLLAFWSAQLPRMALPPLLLAAVLLNAALFSPGEAGSRLDAIARGWQMGKRARLFFGTDWDALWSLPLEGIRREWGEGPEGA